MSRLRRTEILLLAGMLGGAAIAARGLVLEPPAASTALPVGAVAVVNGEAVSRSSFETAVGLVERDRGEPVSGEERDRILQRLVDEELLVQRGIELGLPRSDRKLRGDLVAGVIEAATAAAEGEDPSPEQLRAFVTENRTSFVPPPALRVAQVFVATGPRTDAEAATRAMEAVRRLRSGEDAVTVRRDLGDPPSLEIPWSFVPAGRLHDIVGGNAAAVALGLAAGEISDPLRGDDGYRVLMLMERQAASVAVDPSAVVATAEYRRRRSEDALRDYLAELRRRSDVRVASVAE